MTTQVQIPDTLAPRLTELQADTGVDDISQVVRDALTFYAAAVHHQKMGAKVYIEKDGKKTNLFLKE